MNNHEKLQELQQQVDLEYASPWRTWWHPSSSLKTSQLSRELESETNYQSKFKVPHFQRFNSFQGPLASTFINFKYLILFQLNFVKILQTIHLRFWGLGTYLCVVRSCVCRRFIVNCFVNFLQLSTEIHKINWTRLNWIC